MPITREMVDTHVAVGACMKCLGEGCAACGGTGRESAAQEIAMRKEITALEAQITSLRAELGYCTEVGCIGGFVPAEDWTQPRLPCSRCGGEP